MKIIFFLFAFFLIPQAVLCQHSNPKLAEYVSTFYDAKIASESKIQEVLNEDQENIDRFGPTYLHSTALSKYIQSLPVDDFLDIIEKRNKAYEEDLYKPQEFWLNYDDGIVNSKALDSVRFGIYEGILRGNLEKLYGNATANLILSPITLKIKIIQEEESERIYVSKDSWLGLRIYSVKILDIIKGHSHFNVGDTIQFYYVPFWLSKGSFYDDESYFISLLPVIDNKDGKRRLALDVNNVNDGIIKISQNMVLDEDNYYGLGNVSWTDFKVKISSSININLLKEGLK